jgi:hypothetical protein
MANNNSSQTADTDIGEKTEKDPEWRLDQDIYGTKYENWAGKMARKSPGQETDNPHEG